MEVTQNSHNVRLRTSLQGNPAAGGVSLVPINPDPRTAWPVADRRFADGLKNQSRFIIIVVEVSFYAWY